MPFDPESLRYFVLIGAPAQDEREALLLSAVRLKGNVRANTKLLVSWHKTSLRPIIPWGYEVEIVSWSALSGPPLAEFRMEGKIALRCY